MWKTLTKFGLGSSDLPTIIWNLDVVLRPLTLRIDRRNGARISFVFYITTLVSGVGYLYYLWSIYWMLFVRYPETGDLLGAINAFSLGHGSQISVTKFISMLMYQHTVRDVVAGYLSCDALVKPGSRFASNLARTMRAVKRRAIIFWTVIFGNGIMYITRDLLKDGRYLVDKTFVFYGLEPMAESPNYELSFTANLLSAYFISYSIMSIVPFFITVTGYTEAQLLALNEELTLLWDDAEQHYKDNIETDIDKEVSINKPGNKDKIMNEYIRKRLGDILNSHVTNIYLIRQIEKVFSGAIAAESMLVIVSLIADLLGGLENTFVQLPTALFLLGIDCLVGQRVMDASIVFEKAVYDCNWEKFDVCNRKTVLIMFMNAQKGVTLSAGGVATLNYTCFMSIIRGIYSAYTTLHSTM